MAHTCGVLASGRWCAGTSEEDLTCGVGFSTIIQTVGECVYDGYGQWFCDYTDEDDGTYMWCIGEWEDYYCGEGYDSLTQFVDDAGFKVMKADANCIYMEPEWLCTEDDYEWYCPEN